MNMFANEMLKKVDKEHEEELKKAVAKRKAFQESTKRLRKERDDFKTEVAELKTRLK